MKRLILFIAILIGLTATTLAQSSEKVKTKIEGHGFKKKTKTEGESHKILMSTSAHPAFIHHYTVAKRHTSSGTRRVSHTKPVSSTHVAHYRNTHVAHRNAHVMHYKKIKRTYKNGEYKAKYKT